MDLSDFRQEYTRHGLRRTELAADPFAQFEIWFKQAISSGIHEPNAMTLATVDANGMPLQRTVLLKSFDAGGFTFFTNYTSRKAQHIEGNPQVALLFPWLGLERQVIVQGRAEKVGTEESEAYFSVRPRESQLGAWVSHQSSVITSRTVLTEKLAELNARFGHGKIPPPPFWGGYRVIPQSVEFWQGGPARLHDRFVFTRLGESWHIDRLAP